MKRLDTSIKRKLLTFLTGIFLTITLMGCGDPVAADRKTEHQNLMNIAEQQLQYGLCAEPVATDRITRYQNLMSIAQQKLKYGLYAEPVAADRETEHRTLINIAEKHLQQGLCAYPPVTQTQVLYPAP